MRNWSPAALVVALLISEGTAASEQLELDARAMAETVQRLADAGRWEDAEERLRSALANCVDGDEGKTCRLLVNFNLGHLYHAQSRDQTTRREELLETSAAAYRSVLAEAPQHPATVNNLALVLAEMQDANALLLLERQVQDSDPKLAAVIAALVGDTHASASRWVEAYDAYSAAARLAPRDERPRLRMVEAYAGMADVGRAERAEGFFDALRSWEERFPQAAQDGYRTVVRHRYQSAPDEAEAALSRWISLASERRAFSAAAFNEAFHSLSFAPVRELQEVLAVLEQEEHGQFNNIGEVEAVLNSPPLLNDLPHWSARDGRRHILGMAALALGRASVVAQKPEQAERQWVLGLAMAPPIEEYVIGHLREIDFLPLDLITELVWLQFRFPELDPEERKFAFFIDLLFSGKAIAYDANDLRAIQRHHAVLGEIYAAKGVWQSDWADNAIFQLSNAIRTSNRRAQDEGFYQPLPGVKERLAEGYLATVQPDLAAAAIIDAAQGYLDTDDLVRADMMIQRAGSLVGADRVADLQHVLSLRQSLQSALDGISPMELDAPRIESDLASLALAPAFIARQRFKLLADLAEAGVRFASPEFVREEAESALTASRQVDTLIGTADVLRLERAAGRAGGGEPVTLTVDIEEGIDRGLGPDWQLTMPSIDRPLSATISDGPVN